MKPDSPYILSVPAGHHPSPSALLSPSNLVFTVDLLDSEEDAVFLYVFSRTATTTKLLSLYETGGHFLAGSVAVLELLQGAHKALFFCFFCGAAQALSQRLCPGQSDLLTPVFFLLIPFCWERLCEPGSGNNQVSRGMPCFCGAISILDILFCRAFRELFKFEH